MVGWSSRVMPGTRQCPPWYSQAALCCLAALLPFAAGQGAAFGARSGSSTPPQIGGYSAAWGAGWPPEGPAAASSLPDWQSHQGAATGLGRPHDAGIRGGGAGSSGGMYRPGPAGAALDTRSTTAGFGPSSGYGAAGVQGGWGGPGSLGGPPLGSLGGPGPTGASLGGPNNLGGPGSLGGFSQAGLPATSGVGAGTGVGAGAGAGTGAWTGPGSGPGAGPGPMMGGLGSLGGLPQAQALAQGQAQGQAQAQACLGYGSGSGSGLGHGWSGSGPSPGSPANPSSPNSPSSHGSPSSPSIAKGGSAGGSLPLQPQMQMPAQAQAQTQGGVAGLSAGGLGGSLGGAGLAPAPGVASAGPAGAVLGQPGSAEPEYRQLLGLSEELTRQGRFVEAKAALAVAAQLTNGSPEVLQQAAALRFRMGLREAPVAELDTWLGWRRSGSTGGSAAATATVLGDVQEPEWAEVPSSVPRTSSQIQGHPGQAKPARDRQGWLVMAAGLGVAGLAILVMAACCLSSQSPPTPPAAAAAAALVPGCPAGTGGEGAEGDVSGEDLYGGLGGGRLLAHLGFQPDRDLGPEAGTSSTSHSRASSEVGTAPPEALARDLDSAQTTGPARTGRNHEQSAGVNIALATAEQVLREDADDEEEEATSSEQPVKQDVPTAEEGDAEEEGEEEEEEEEEGEEEEEEQDEGLGIEQEEAEDKNEGEDKCPGEIEEKVQPETAEEAEAEDTEDEEEEEVQEGAAEPSPEADQEEEEEDEEEEEVEDNETGAADLETPPAGEAETSQEPTAAVGEGGVPLALRAQMVQIGGRTVSIYELCQELGAHSVPAALGHHSQQLPVPTPPQTQSLPASSQKTRTGTVTPKATTLSPSAKSQPQPLQKAPQEEDWANPPTVEEEEEDGDWEQDGEDAEAEEVEEAEAEFREENEQPEWPERQEETQEAGHQEEEVQQEQAEEAEEAQEGAGSKPRQHHAAPASSSDRWEAPRRPGEQEEWNWDSALDRKEAAAVSLALEGDDSWAWGQPLGLTSEERQAANEEARRASEAIAASWAPRAMGWTGPPDMRKAVTQATKPSTTQTAGQPSRQRGRAVAKGSSKPKDPDPVTSSPSSGAKAAAPPVEATPPDPVQRSGRLWQPGRTRSGTGAAAKPREDKRESQQDHDRNPPAPAPVPVPLEEEVLEPGDGDFRFARPTRFRPTGCFVRLQGSGAEAWLPVEHMQPRTEATTHAIRELMRSIAGGRLRVRDTGDGDVSMFSAKAAEAKAAEIQARRSSIEEGIAHLRENYEARKWLSGHISALQGNGAYVSLVEGKDAFIPASELPPGSLPSDEDKGSLQVGHEVQFRVIRWAYQSDTFYASMLSYEESVAKSRAARGLPPAGAAQSATPAARAASVEPSRLLRDPAASSSRDRARSTDVAKDSQRWASKGFSIVSNTTADELNAMLRKSTEEQKLKKSGGSKAGPKSADKKYIVNVVRGMNSKVIGQITLPTRASEKEVKDAAVALITKEGELKAGQDHKGVTIAKNVLSVKV